MKEYIQKAVIIREVVKFDGQNTLEIKEFTSGYGYEVEQFGDELHIKSMDRRWVLQFGDCVILDNLGFTFVMGHDFKRRYEQI